ncbi:MAG: phosphoglycolate phosphatase [Candidatus Binatia bacterium]|nr:MAG: phosphoglycolate phosphatase [Candidatus Binatia bacterium]
MSCLVAFDLDGVLYSSEPFLADAYRAAAERVNSIEPGAIPRVPEVREILRHVGWPVPQILDNVFPDLHEAARSRFRELVLEEICRRVEREEGFLYEGVPETLEKLRERGASLAIASNGRKRYVKTVLGTYGLESLFVPVLTVEDVEPQEKATVLRAYLERHGIPAERCVFVGDRASDVAAARRVGCFFVGCAYGHGEGREISGAGPCIGSLRELPSLVDVFLGRGT